MTSFINQDKRFFFVHVPKTGGMTVTRFFSYGRDRSWRQVLSPLNAEIGIHEGAGEIRGLLGQEADRYFSFAFYRNSWDWAFSLYRYIRRTKGHPWHDRVRDLSFRAYADQVAASFYRPQKPMVVGDGRVLVTRLEDFRDLGQSLPEILEELGYDPGDLRRENAAPVPQDYRDVYDRESREAIGRIYRDDIDYFGFRFGD